MIELRSLLVGAHFRPPAKLILAHLPAGTSLVLDPEPDNPYDEHAIRVLVDAGEIPESEYEALTDELPAMGEDLDELLAQPDLIHLGYVAATGGKPLIKYMEENGTVKVIGNQEIIAALTQPDHTAQLDFGAGGEALVIVTIP
jgi:hypothetical protein